MRERLNSDNDQGACERITGHVLRDNVIEYAGREVACFKKSPTDGWELALDLTRYIGRRITIAGYLKGPILYHAEIHPRTRACAS